MFWSKNDFFKQTKEELILARAKVVDLLKIKGVNDEVIDKYLSAYNFFMVYPEKFDGATIVKDLVDVRQGKYYLDLNSCKHDFDYIKGANRNFIKKWKADLKYIKEMEQLGKGVRVFRLLLLTLTGIVLVPYINICR